MIVARAARGDDLAPPLILTFSPHAGRRDRATFGGNGAASCTQAGLWVAFTLTASAAQTARNVMQRELTGALGRARRVAGALSVRPAVRNSVLRRLAGRDRSRGAVDHADRGWLHRHRRAGADRRHGADAGGDAPRSFVVVVAFTKTEAAQVALYALLFLGETPTVTLIGAIALATIGVFLMAGSGAETARAGWRPIAMGLASATFFAFAAVGFRGAVTRMATPSAQWRRRPCWSPASPFRPRCCWSGLPLFDRAGLKAILALWRASLLAGFMGALASQLWFVAFALTDAARVRTLALVEVLFAQAASLKLFREPPTRANGSAWR